LLQAYSWPGNIRELRYTIESMLNFIDGNMIEVQDLPHHLRHLSTSHQFPESGTSAALPHASLNEKLRAYEKNLIQQAIKEANGNGAEAARMLNIPRQTLHNKLKKYHIEWEIKLHEPV